MANVGINSDDQRRIEQFKRDFSARYEGRTCDDRKRRSTWLPTC